MAITVAQKLNKEGKLGMILAEVRNLTEGKPGMIVAEMESRIKKQEIISAKSRERDSDVHVDNLTIQERSVQREIADIKRE